jgi:hypothetical protein
VDRCEDFCIPNVDLLGVTDEDAPCFQIVSTILDLLEQGLNWLLGIPSLAHVFEVDLEVMLASPTMLSFKMSKYIGSNTLMICFFNACWTEVHVQ